MRPDRLVLAGIAFLAFVVFFVSCSVDARAMPSVDAVGKEIETPEKSEYKPTMQFMSTSILCGYFDELIRFYEKSGFQVWDSIINPQNRRQMIIWHKSETVATMFTKDFMMPVFDYKQGAIVNAHMLCLIELVPGVTEKMMLEVEVSSAERMERRNIRRTGFGVSGELQR